MKTNVFTRLSVQRSTLF